MNNPQISYRGRDTHEQHRTATPLELLFDLTFVVAIAAASSQLHHGVVEHHTAQAAAGYMLAFIAIWWAWMNYTWFASAYDNDDTLFRILTMMQMGGVLILATGIPGLFTENFLASVIGYIVMRLALCTQWLLAAKGDPPRRRSCLRYATGIALVQLGWVIFLLTVNHNILAGNSLWAAIILLWLFELMVPIWAERASETPWHAHHIAERYGLMTIIVLGECVLGTTNSIANMWQTYGWTFDLVLMGFAGTLIIFALWWMYFLLPSADAMHHHRERVWIWGYGHYILFAAIAAIGSGLEVVADTIKSVHVDIGTHTSSLSEPHGVSPLYAICMVALAEAIFVISLWGLHRYAVRALETQLSIMLVCLACIAIGPITVALGLPLSWGLLTLSLGPFLIIAYNEKGRQDCTDYFAVR